MLCRVAGLKILEIKALKKGLLVTSQVKGGSSRDYVGQLSGNEWAKATRQLHKTDSYPLMAPLLLIKRV
jgi:hypothetical protein